MPAQIHHPFETTRGERCTWKPDKYHLPYFLSKIKVIFQRQYDAPRPHIPIPRSFPPLTPLGTAGRTPDRARSGRFPGRTVPAPRRIPNTPPRRRTGGLPRRYLWKVELYVGKRQYAVWVINRGGANRHIFEGEAASYWGDLSPSFRIFPFNQLQVNVCFQQITRCRNGTTNRSPRVEVKRSVRNVNGTPQGRKQASHPLWPQLKRFRHYC